MKGLTDTDQRLMLTELTVETANKAARVIADNARDRAELALFMQMVAPAPHRVDAAPNVRRALPRRGAEK